MRIGDKTTLAEDFETNEQVVIKILEFNDLFCWQDLKLFEREAKTLQNLNHPHIPNYLDYFEINDENRLGFALVQTYIAAPSLAELIERGIKFSEAEIIELAKKLLDILNYFHRLNPPVIHRDIKPSNILLTNRSGNSIGDVYLVDFGSVQTVAKKEAGSITIVGSYGYIPLEQFMGQTTFASDLYSLGMTLIYLVTGIHPAELTQPTGKVKFDTSTISREFARWLRKITEPYIDKRYASAELALTALHSEYNNYENTKILLSNQSKDLTLNISPDRTSLEISYRVPFKLISYLRYALPSYLPLLVICLVMGISSLAPLSSLYFFIHFILATILPLPPKYRIISLNKHKQIREGFYVGDCQSLEWQRSSSLQINRVIYSPSYTIDKCFDGNKRLVPAAKLKVDAKLSIIARYEEFCICETKKVIAISDPDLWWLGNEISDFLDLKLEVISQTPVIPNIHS